MAIQGHRSKVPKAVRLQRMVSLCAVPESRHGDQFLVKWITTKIIQVLPVIGAAFQFNPDDIVRQSSPQMQTLLIETASPSSQDRVTSSPGGYVQRSPPSFSLPPR